MDFFFLCMATWVRLANATDHRVIVSYSDQVDDRHNMDSEKLLESFRGNENAHISADVKSAIDGITSRCVSEQANCSLVSMSPCSTTTLHYLH